MADTPPGDGGVTGLSRSAVGLTAPAERSAGRGVAVGLGHEATSFG
jgi:hypothetical protein